MTRWEPGRELFLVPRAIDQLFNEQLWLSRSNAQAAYLPLDVRQVEGAFVLEANLPGFTPEEVEVVANRGLLTIRGEHGDESTAEGDYLRRERRQVSFQRQLTLPEGVSEGDISASLENGVLSVRVPRAALPEPTRIKVEAGAEAPAQTDPGEAEAAEPVAA